MRKGSIVALVTPFREDGEIDESTLRSLLNWHADQGTDGILVCGTTGESATLSHQEHKHLIDIAVQEIDGRIPVIAGCGSNATREALDLTRYAHQAGADAALVITPYYNKPTQEGLYRHFKTIADDVGIPILLYNVPSRTGVNMTPETVIRLYRDCKNIVGLKEAGGSLDQMTALMKGVDKEFLLYSGTDELILPVLSVGGAGVVSVVANILPRQTHRLVQSFLQGNREEAATAQFALYDLIKTLFIETNPIPVKTALGLMGRLKPVLRLPLCPMGESHLEKLTQALTQYGIL
ncbi:MAG: 4-hydroxy-tetrahydrodipicolinate synthase [Candidatus Omnitrophica bacterium]|nr:4-hydroxy-tetrahydrodipicolinate synthase [Candidatus Omnitrophota bacterium]